MPAPITRTASGLPPGARLRTSKRCRLQLQVESKAPSYAEYFQTEVQPAQGAQVRSIAGGAPCRLNPSAFHPRGATALGAAWVRRSRAGLSASGDADKGTPSGLSAYACAREFGHRVVIGPVIAKGSSDASDAMALIASLAGCHHGRFVRIDR